MKHEQSRVRIPDLLKKKAAGQKITMMTAYDASMAHWLDQAGIDALLVGDSLGMVVQGNETTIPVTLDAMVYHSRAVARGAQRALIVADMPFLTYQVSIEEAVRNAGRLIQEGNASAVKLEGGIPVAETVRRISEAGIPVMGHIGLTPQAVHRFGGYRIVGKTRHEADQLMLDAEALSRAGAFAVVLECIPAETAALITGRLDIPTIGIGAGVHCDGQVLVSYDAFGLYGGPIPRFVKKYADLGAQIVAATKEYIADVEEESFPVRERSLS